MTAATALERLSAALYYGDAAAAAQARADAATALRELLPSLRGPRRWRAATHVLLLQLGHVTEEQASEWAGQWLAWELAEELAA